MILITGASSGIGKYIFEHYSKTNNNVFGTYYSTKPENTSNLSKVDVTNYKQVKEWINGLEDLNNLQLINSAGITDASYAHKTNIDYWHKVIDVNVKGVFNTIRAVLPLMREQRFGRIINFSSVVPKIGVVGVSAYATSKAALWGMVKTLSNENAPLGITINNINQGHANIGMGVEKVPEINQKMLKNKIPVGRFCEPEEIISTVELLLNNAFITGASIDVNGGLA